MAYPSVPPRSNKISNPDLDQRSEEYQLCTFYPQQGGVHIYQIIPYSLLTNTYTTNSIRFNTTTTLTSLSVSTIRSMSHHRTRRWNNGLTNSGRSLFYQNTWFNSLQDLGESQNQRVMLQQEVLLKTRPHVWPHPYPLPLLLPRELDGSQGGYGLFHN